MEAIKERILGKRAEREGEEVEEMSLRRRAERKRIKEDRERETEGDNSGWV